MDEETTNIDYTQEDVFLVADLLCDESWQGRWNPREQGLNARPLANHTALVLVKAPLSVV